MNNAEELLEILEKDSTPLVIRVIRSSEQKDIGYILGNGTKGPTLPLRAVPSGRKKENGEVQKLGGKSDASVVYNVYEGWREVKREVYAKEAIKILQGLVEKRYS